MESRVGSRGGAMTERKPAGKSWETWIEELIHYAREAGEFEAHSWDHRCL
jgi:hypothetical protein